MIITWPAPWLTKIHAQWHADQTPNEMDGQLPSPCLGVWALGEILFAFLENEEGNYYTQINSSADPRFLPLTTKGCKPGLLKIQENTELRRESAFYSTHQGSSTAKAQAPGCSATARLVAHRPTSQAVMKGHGSPLIPSSSRAVRGSNLESDCLSSAKHGEPMQHVNPTPHAPQTCPRAACASGRGGCQAGLPS